MMARPEAKDSASLTETDAPETAFTVPRKVGSVPLTFLAPFRTAGAARLSAPLFLHCARSRQTVQGHRIARIARNRLIRRHQVALGRGSPRNSNEFLASSSAALPGARRLVLRLRPLRPLHIQ